MSIGLDLSKVIVCAFCGKKVDRVNKTCECVTNCHNRAHNVHLAVDGSRFG